MVALLFNLSGFCYRSKGVWLLPIFLFLLLLVTRSMSAINSNIYTLYFVYNACLILMFILSVAFMLSSLRSMFIHGYSLKSEVIFYKKLGYGIITQFAIKVFMTLILTFILWFFCSAVMWHFSYRTLIILVVTYSLLLMLRTATVVFKTSLVYYVAAVLFSLSFLYPVYILPNPAYMLKGGVMQVAYYSAVYILLYVIVGYKFFISSWRNECIGWMF